MKQRIYIEKKGIFDVESPKVLQEIKTVVPNIKGVKVYNIYDVFGLPETDFTKVVGSVFADPVTDIIHYSNPAKNLYFAMEFYLGNMTKEPTQQNNVSLYLLKPKMLKYVAVN